MMKIDLSKTASLAGFGLLSGFAGSVVMLLSQQAEMRVTGRASSDTPAKAVETITGTPSPGKKTDHMISTAAHLAFGTGLGLGLAALSKVPEPARGLAFLVGAWGAGTALITGLGLSDPPTRWDTKTLTIDLGHHAVYAGSAAATFFGLRRLARI